MGKEKAGEMKKKIIVIILLVCVPVVIPANNKKTLKIPKDMVLIPAGAFVMGSDEEELNTVYAENEKAGFSYGKNWFSHEKPKHKVELDAYFIDKYEVTNAQYKKCVSEGKCKKPYDTTWYNDAGKQNHPVVYVDWFMSDTFCKWSGKRLPTEAEWEKASRGENGNIWPWGNEFDCKKSCNSVSPCNQNSTRKVGSFSSDVSSYGVVDMAGNVWEWVSDWYDKNYYKNSPEKNPKGPSNGQTKVLRGGSWGDDNPVIFRGADRIRLVPSVGGDSGGFRCASSGG